MVPMRYLCEISRSNMFCTLSDLDDSNACVRACNKGNFKFRAFHDLFQHQLGADAATQTLLRRWLCNRLMILFGFMVTCTVLVAMWVPNILSTGAIGLCLVNLYQTIVRIEGDIDIAMNAQFQFISMKRLHDYTSLEQEADFDKSTDMPYRSYFVHIKRSTLGILKQDGRNIVRKRPVYDQTILEQTDRTSFKATNGFNVLDPSSDDLKNCQEWHRLVAANGKRSASACSDFADNELVKELCQGESSEIILEIESGWLRPGAHILIEDLVAGYGDIATNVLSNINIDILPRSKVGIVGTTGCGKSTLFLCMLRILQPRSGHIWINGVDTATLGIKVLRTSIGLVAQDPVMMQGTLRDNLDPFGQFDDEALWKGLDMVQLKDHIQGLKGGLDFEIGSDAGNLSFGQRQLLSMARMVIRQPAMILLDEATSALDPATQQQVQQTLEQDFPNSTLVVIAHRLETIIDFDNIIVLEKGRVAEQGNPTRELRDKKDGLFAKMWSAKLQGGG